MLQCVKSAAGCNPFHKKSTGSEKFYSQIFTQINSQLREIKRSVYMEHDIQVVALWSYTNILFFYLERTIDRNMGFRDDLSSV